jgi:hypothetical protein
MEATFRSETSVDFQPTTQYHLIEIELIITTSARTSCPTDWFLYYKHEIWLRQYATSRKVAVSRLGDSIECLSVDLTIFAMALGFTQPLTEICTRSRKSVLESRARPVRKADYLTAICEPTV